MDYKEIKSKIKPAKKNESDKYSWQLFQFVSKHKNLAERVFVQKRDYNPKGEISKANTSDIIIGSYWADDDSMCGNSLGNIISPSRDKYQRNCYLNKRLGWDLVERTDEFWQGYIDIGRCFLDKEHRYCFTGNRWDYIDSDNRVCKWCGHKQHIERYTFTEERERWIDEE